MKEERMYILNLLGDGKINADEAAKLLEALGKKPIREYWDDDFNAEEKLLKFRESVETFAKDFGSKMGSAYKDMEPKVRKTTKVIMEKTASAVDGISKSLHESLKNIEAKGALDDEDDEDSPKDN
jgi:hypothetical protein